MRHLLLKVLAGSGLALLALTASAQYQPRPPYASQAQDERETRDHDRLFDRVRTDLDRAHAGTLPFTADRNRVVSAREQLNECQRMINTGDYDRRTFDEAVTAIQRVVDLNRLSDQNRDYLVNDIRELHRLQSRLES